MATDADPRTEELASKINELHGPEATWLTFMQGVRPFIGLHDTTDDSLDHEPSAEQRHPADEAALLAFSYKPSFDEEDGRPRFSLGPSWITNDESWPPPPSEVTGEVAAEWPILADLVTAAAPKGRLHAVCFLRGGAERVRHGASAITAYLSAAQMAARKPEAIEYWQSGLRLARALRDVHAATRAQEGLLDFAENELSQSTKLGFAIQALEVAAAEPSCPARIDDLLEAVTQSATHVSVVDRALRIMLGRANPAAKPGIWRRRVEVHRVDALAADHPLVKSAKLHKALKLAQMSGLTELRDEVAADLQECANQDLGMVAFSASSAIFDEEVAKIIDAMVAGDSWEQSLVTSPTFRRCQASPRRTAN